MQFFFALIFAGFAVGFFRLMQRALRHTRGDLWFAHFLMAMVSLMLAVMMLFAKVSE